MAPESSEALLARVDERTESMQAAQSTLFEKVDGIGDRLDHLSGRMTSYEKTQAIQQERQALHGRVIVAIVLLLLGSGGLAAWQAEAIARLFGGG